jgi:carbamate kinase
MSAGMSAEAADRVPDRVVVALGGNAMVAEDGSATPQAQRAAIERAMEHVADLMAAGTEIVLTHGNGPQVGNLLVKNEAAAHVVPPVPLDWCGAQTQATIGFLVLNALERALGARGIHRGVAALVTRTLVDPNDPGFRRPTKPIGRYVSRAEAETFIAHGQVWEERGEHGWRRMVASPEPIQVLDSQAARVLLQSGYAVVCAGGGGIPVVRDPDGTMHGVEAVLDKDLTASLLAMTLQASALVIATDVESAVVGFGTPDARPLGKVSAAELRKYADEGHFASGSMGPKVEAILRFVEAGGRRAAITSLDRLDDAVRGEAGTIVDHEEF